MSRNGVIPAVYIAVTGMELCYLYLGLSLLRNNLGLNELSILFALMLYSVPAVAEVLATDHPRLKAIARPVALLLVLASCLLAVKQIIEATFPVAGMVALMGFCALGYWLGYSIARVEKNHHQVLFRFQMGILFFILFSGASILFPVVVFAILAIFALSRARWESTLEVGGRVLQTIPLWWLLLGSIAVIVPVFLVIVVISPDIARMVFGSIGYGYNSFISWFTYLMSLEFWQKPLIDINWRPSCLEGLPENAPKPTPAPTPMPGASEIPTSLLAGIGAVFIIAVLIYLTVAIIKMRRKKKRVRAPVRVSFKVASSKVNFIAEIKAFFRWLIKQIYRLFASLKKARIMGLNRGSDEVVTSIRSLYRELLRWSAKHAVPRANSQTATEFLTVLGSVYPEQRSELALITDIYLQARYGSSSVTHDQFEFAQKAWQKVKAAVASLAVRP